MAVTVLSAIFWVSTPCILVLAFSKTTVLQDSTTQITNIHITMKTKSHSAVELAEVSSWYNKKVCHLKSYWPKACSLLSFSQMKWGHDVVARLHSWLVGSETCITINHQGARPYVQLPWVVELTLHTHRVVLQLWQLVQTAHRIWLVKIGSIWPLYEMHASVSISASYSSGRLHGAALVLAFRSAISCRFHLRL